MTLKGLSVLSALLVSFLLGFSQSTSAQQPDYFYAYLSQEGLSPKSTIHFLDPSQIEKGAVRTQVFPANLFTPDFMSVSPDGRWIAALIGIGNPSCIGVGIVNTRTWQTTTIITGYTSSIDSMLVWSPNSRFLAVSFHQCSQKDADLFVYDVDQMNLSDLSTGNGDYHSISWSSDSRQILAFVDRCGDEGRCTDGLELFDLKTHSRLSRLDISGLPRIGQGACNAVLSPNHKLVIFTSVCGLTYMDLDFAHEVYLWDIEAHSLKQITDYSLKRTDILFFTFYQYVWLNDQEILIGVNNRPGGALHAAPEEQQLITYRLDTDVMHILSNELGSEFLVYEPSHQIALIRQARINFEHPSMGGEEAHIRFQNLPTAAGKLVIAPDTLPLSTVTVPFQCLAQWEPNGEMLASVSSTTVCNRLIETITFTDPVLETSRTFRVPYDQRDATYVSLGWIAAE